jgi:hypothetical protein
MSVEALWSVKFGHAGGGEMLHRNGGIVVLETDRILGGDTWFSYIGVYSTTGDQVLGKIKIKRHNFDPDSTDAWNTDANEFEISFSVLANGDRTQAVGTMELIGGGMPAIKLRLDRIAELP